MSPGVSEEGKTKEGHLEVVLYFFLCSFRPEEAWHREGQGETELFGLVWVLQIVLGL